MAPDGLGDTGSPELALRASSSRQGRMNELAIRAALGAKFKMGAAAREEAELCTMADCSISLARSDKIRMMLTSHVIFFL